MISLDDLAGVLLDLDGVLLDYHAAERQAFAGVAMRVGLYDIDAARTVYAEINSGLWREYERGEVGADELRVLRWERLLDHHGLDAGAARKVSADYLQLLGRSPAVMPGAVQALRHLTPRVPVVAVTNGFAEVAGGRLRAAGVAADLAGMVAADQVAAPKPDPAMFEAGLGLLGNPVPDAVLMVGDNHHADIVGARDVGLRTAWVAPGEVAEPGVGGADLRADSLASVVDTITTTTEAREADRHPAHRRRSARWCLPAPDFVEE